MQQTFTGSKYHNRYRTYCLSRICCLTLILIVSASLGAEHLSVGEFDETGTGPSDVNERRRLAGETRLGFQCKYYDNTDSKFTTQYNWQHCVDMEVGQTYEVHWPHSAGAACGTLNQYQTPFYDGVFCKAELITETASQIGVQAQVFTIVNDESYYYPGMCDAIVRDL